jgi:hypothetical protein
VLLNLRVFVLAFAFGFGLAEADDISWLATVTRISRTARLNLKIYFG